MNAETVKAELSRIRHVEAGVSPDAAAGMLNTAGMNRATAVAVEPALASDYSEQYSARYVNQLAAGPVTDSPRMKPPAPSGRRPPRPPASPSPKLPP